MTTYSGEHNGTAVPINSTTIQVPRNASTFITPGIHFIKHYSPLSIPGVPTDLLASNYDGNLDYAGTEVNTDTVATFSHTDLVITQPTPYDEWINIGIYTETPNVSVCPSSDFSIWPASICGTYTTETTYSVSQCTVTSGSSTFQSYASRPTPTYTQLRPSNPKKDLFFWFGNYYNNGITLLKATYVQAKTTQITEERMYVPLPTDIIDWLATQDHVIEEYPYIKNCFLGPRGSGQPTAHVPVAALTITSSHFLREKETPTTEFSGKGTVTVLTTSEEIFTITNPTATTDRSMTSSADAGPPSISDSGTQGSTRMLQSASDVPGNTAEKTPASEHTESRSTSGGAHQVSDKPGQQPLEVDDNEQMVNAATSALSTRPPSTASQTKEVVEGIMSALQSLISLEGEVPQDSHGSEAAQQSNRIESARASTTTASKYQISI